MIHEERILKLLHAPHISEKTSAVMGNTNTIVLKVAKDATKTEIKTAVQRLLEAKVKTVNTLIIKGKIKRYGQHIGRRSNWKKSYVTLREGYSLDFTKSTD